MDPASLFLHPRDQAATNQIHLAGILQWCYRLIGRFVVLDISRLMIAETQTLKKSRLALPEFQFRELTRDDLHRHSTSADLRIADDAKERLDRQHRCFAAFHGNLLISYCWFARHSIDADNNRGRHPQSGVGLNLPDDAVFVYDAITIKAYRGRNVISSILHHAASFLVEDGILRALTTTDWTNTSALRAMEKSRFRSLGTICKLSLMNASLTFVPKQATAMGIQALE